MTNSVREQVLIAARAQVRELAIVALESALDTLETRVIRARARSVDAISGANRQLERSREVLERDRALASTLPMPPNCHEPIRTRSMAKLLASQGHRDRALSIYRHLLARNERDVTLEAEIAELEAQPPR